MKLNNISILNRNEEVRSLFWDFCKSWAIILVIIGHCLQYLGPEEFVAQPSYNSFYRLIYSFHMPLFIFISGYFTQYNNISFFSFVSKKFIRLILPTIIWTLIIYLFISLPYHLITNKFSLYSFISNCINFLINGFWFLKVLFILTIAYSFSNFLLKNIYLRFLMIILFVYIIYLVKVPHGGGAFKYLYFYIFGLFLRENNQVLNVLLMRKTAIICFFSFILIYYLNDSDILKFYDLTNMLEYNLKARLVQIFIGLLGTICFIQLLFFYYQATYKSKITRLISFAGTKTLHIYILQTVLIEFILSRIIHIDLNNILFSYILCPIISLILLGLILEIIKVIELRDFINKLLFCKY